MGRCPKFRPLWQLAPSDPVQWCVEVCVHGFTHDSFLSVWGTLLSVEFVVARQT